MGFVDVATSAALLEKSVAAACLITLDCFWPACQRVLKGIPQHEPLLLAPRRGPPVLPEIAVADSRNLLPVSWRAVLCDSHTGPRLSGSIFDGGCEAIDFQQPLAGLMPHKVIEPALVDQPVKRRPRLVSNGFGCVT
jgi:hypothetical protein